MYDIYISNNYTIIKAINIHFLNQYIYIFCFTLKVKSNIPSTFSKIIFNSYLMAKFYFIYFSKFPDNEFKWRNRISHQLLRYLITNACTRTYILDYYSSLRFVLDENTLLIPFKLSKTVSEQKRLSQLVYSKEIYW